MKLPWNVVILSLLISSCGDVDSQLGAEQRRVESDLELLVAEFDEVLRSGPESIHGPSEMRAEYEELKRKSQLGDSRITEEYLADCLAFVQQLEKKVERLKCIRSRMMENSEEFPDIHARVTSRRAKIETDSEGDDPFR